MVAKNPCPIDCTDSTPCRKCRYNARHRAAVKVRNAERDADPQKRTAYLAARTAYRTARVEMLREQDRALYARLDPQAKGEKNKRKYRKLKARMEDGALAARQRFYRAQHPEQSLAIERMSRGVLNADICPQLVLDQNSKCAICPEPITFRSHADHDHRTGLVRGMLCERCNRGVGLFLDDPVRMRAAAAYIENPPGAKYYP